MASSPSVGVKDLLVAASVGVFVSPTTSDWGIKIGQRTDIPAKQIIIYDTPGRSPNPKFAVDYPTIQVLIRGAVDGYVVAFQKARDVKDVLLGIDSQDLNGDRWVSIVGMGDINFLEYDDSSRPEFSLNFALIIEPAIGALSHRESL